MATKKLRHDTDSVHIQTQDKPDIVIGLGANMQTIAMRWAYVVRNRVRWSQDNTALENIRNSARNDLMTLGMSEASLSDLSSVEIVEVVVPFETEENGWEARILPWEFLLTAAASQDRRAGSLIVVRSLKIRGTQRKSREPKTLALVSSLPNRLRVSGYSFDSEVALVQSNLSLEPSKMLVNPTLARLRKELTEFMPDIVHFAGIDLHQGNRFLGRPEARSATIHDGYFLTAEDGNEYPASALEIAQAVNAAPTKPVFACVNTYNSAARIAALIVAEGTNAAIGFQDEIDDLVAEQFLTMFYRAWRELNWDLLRAFRAAFYELAANADKNNIGTGIVLWSREPLLRQSLLESVRDDEEHLRQTRVATSDSQIEGNLLSDLDLDIVPVASINYSLLHNRQPLFQRFCLRNKNKSLATIRGVRLLVELCTGEQIYPFRTMLDVVAGTPKELKDEIHTPLTSTLFRSLRESVQSVLFVKVETGNAEIQMQTHSVRLLAIDEWMDEPQLNAFLPSFVLPRDHAVLRVIDAAQRHLITLTDDPGAGFDGYQSVNRQDGAEPVDLQVRAIWSALSHDFSISYINPPPTFTERSQRLRSPSDVLEGGRGTCIDLALLLAATLEYVGIYPVLFLLQGHAFAGYWRTVESRDSFVQVGTQFDAGIGVEQAKKRPSPYPWLELQEGYEEIVSLVRSEDLAPIETVWITQQKGYWDARDAGMENLRSRVEFEAMIDIKGARDKQVTPLPVARG